MEARCTDGSTIKLKLLPDNLTLKTDYGKLRIPVARIKRIECATRIPAAVRVKVDRAIENLGDDDHDKRMTAEAELAKYKLLAYPALLKKENAADLEVRMRVQRLLKAVRETASEEELEVRYHDIVHTDDSKITGDLQEESLSIYTKPFGDVTLKLSDVRWFRRPGEADEEEAGKAEDAPLNMSALGAQVGKVFRFRVTGANVGIVYGTDTYTTDSALAVAAVHAGLVKTGKTAVVKVKVLPNQPGFTGSFRNGVTTNNYPALYPAYQFVKRR
jgi:hypothetical protein